MTDLTPDEVDGLAMRLVVEHLRDLDDRSRWLGWADVPELTEAQFELLWSAVDDFARKVARDLRAWELLHDIDTAELVERVS